MEWRGYIIRTGTWSSGGYQDRLVCWSTLHCLVMPSEHNYQPHAESPTSQHPQSQPKSCPSCYALVFVPELDAPATCPNCREQVLLRVAQSQNNSNRRLIDQDIPSLPPSRDLSSTLHNTRPSPVPISDSPPPSLTLALSPPRLGPSIEFSKPYTTPIYRLEESPLPLPTSHFTHPPASSVSQPHSHEPQEKPPITQALVSTPDPLADITRLRVRTRANRCLYPGATFEGTQKSGRNSYDVTVTIVVCHLFLLSHVLCCLTLTYAPRSYLPCALDPIRTLISLPRFYAGTYVSVVLPTIGQS